MSEPSYTHSQVVSASDYCIEELVKAVEAGKGKEFNPSAVIGKWAEENYIPEAKKEDFVQEAKKVFEAEVIVRGLKELRDMTPVELAAERARNRRMLFSGVYTLYEPRRRISEELDEEE